MRPQSMTQAAAEAAASMTQAAAEAAGRSNRKGRQLGGPFQESGAAAHLLNEVGVHDDEQAEERDGAGEVEVLEREADPRGEQLGQHPRQARVHPQERLLRIHPPAAPPPATSKP